MTALRCLLSFLLLGITCSVSAQSPKTLELSDFLDTYLNWSSLPAYISNSLSAQESSYDRTGMNNDGFNGTYSFVRRNADSTLVLLDVKGPGVINRIWTPTPTDDTLDFYLDDTSRVAFSIQYRDLYSGKVSPFVSPLCANQLGGFFCYLPIPFQKACKIVLRGKYTMFHQIGYRLYGKGTNMKTFRLPLTAAENDKLKAIATSWSQPGKVAQQAFYQQTAQTINNNIQLKPGDAITLFESKQPGRIIGWELTSAAPLLEKARDIDIRITWDDEPAPAVYCPLADFFGYAFGKASMQGLLAGTQGNTHYSFFPMPFDRSAKVELIYRRKKGDEGMVSLVSNIQFVPQPRDPAKEGKFYAHWNRSNPVPVGQPYTMLNAKGKGHFAGVNLQAQGLKPGITLFFEGDDSTVIDGQLRFHGTGSEDFFNGGWYALLDCWEAARSLPLSGALDYSIPLCRTGGYRFFLNDKMSFEKSIGQTIEHGPEFNRFPSDYSSVAYYYCSENNGAGLVPSTANTGIYMPDTMEVYPQLTPVQMDGKTLVDPRWEFGITAKTMFYTVEDGSLLQYSLAGIPEGNYQVFFDHVKGPDAASFRLWQAQTPLTDWIDARAEKDTRFPSAKMTAILLTRLNNTLTVRFNTEGKRNRFTLSRMILVREK